MHSTARRIAGTGAQRTRFGHTPRFREGLYALGSRTYAWMVPNGSWGETNLGLVDCDGRSVLIDTAWNVRFTHEFLTAAQEIIARSPVECLVNTHADGDHCWGNQLFAEKTIIGTHRCISQFEHISPETMMRLKKMSPWLQRLPFQIATELGRYVEDMCGPYDFEGVRLAKPNRGFSGECSIVINGVEIVLFEAGPAHTDGDAIVYIPRERVVYAGDLLFVGVTPVMWSGPIENMYRGLRRLLSLDVDILVPGHGPLATRANVQALLDYWEYVEEALDRCFRLGIEPVAAARSVLGSDRFQCQPFGRWDAPERLVTTAHTLYRKRGWHGPRWPEQLATLNLLRHQARTAYGLSDMLRGAPREPTVPRACRPDRGRWPE